MSNLIELAVVKIFDTYKNSSLYDDLGALYYDQAPEGTSGDYIIYSVITDGAEYTFTEYLEHITLQFNIFTTERNSPLSVIQYTERLRSLFDNTSYRFSGEGESGGIVDMRREGGTRPMRDPDRGFFYPTRYRLLIEEI